jgi:hypothetical protein
MKAIKITVENTAAIESALHSVNGKATTHTFTKYRDIESVAYWAEKKLEKLGIPKAIRNGARITQESGDILPARYKYQAQTTMVTLERKSSGWYLINAQTSKLYPKSKPYSEFYLTIAQDTKAIEVLRRDYNIIEGV